MIGIGIDIGSVAAKGILINKEEQHQVLVPTGWSPRSAGEIIIGELLHRSGLSRPEIDQVVVTGYGRIALQSADQTVTEIKCHARGIAELYPQVRTIIDIGGQDSKVIHVGASGKVLDFAMNDKCAAGTGRFLEVMARVMETDVSQLGQLAGQADSPVDISNTCAVFAESEVISRLSAGIKQANVAAGIHQSVARRVAGLAMRVGVTPTVVLTGGVAKNEGIVQALSAELKQPITVAPNCQLTGALGAALMALKEALKLQIKQTIA